MNATDPSKQTSSESEDSSESECQELTYLHKNIIINSDK